MVSIANPFRRRTARQQPAAARQQPAAARQQTSARSAPVRTEPPRVRAAPLRRFASQNDEQHFDPSGQYNPQAFGGYVTREGIRQAVPSAANRLFDKQGQLNAQDNKDALQQIAYLLQDATRRSKSARFETAASQMASQERKKVLAAAMNDPEGFAILGQELLLPIKDIVDYEGWGRKVYRVRPLQQGEFFRVAKDVRATAWVIGQDGQGVESRLAGKYVQPSEFKIASFPTVDISDIYQMNFDVLDRAQDTARQEIELEEDKRGVALLDVAAPVVNTIQGFAALGPTAFEAIRYQVERHRLVVEKFLINRAEITDLVTNAHTTVDPVTERELILAGYVGNILNAQIITAAGTGVEEVVAAGDVFAVTSPDHLGEIGVRVELFSEPFNMFSQQRLVKGWAFAEIVGFVLVNPRAVAKGQKT